MKKMCSPSGTRHRPFAKLLCTFENKLKLERKYLYCVSFACHQFFIPALVYSHLVSYLPRPMVAYGSDKSFQLHRRNITSDGTWLKCHCHRKYHILRNNGIAPVNCRSINKRVCGGKKITSAICNTHIFSHLYGSVNVQCMLQDR